MGNNRRGPIKGLLGPLVLMVALATPLLALGQEPPAPAPLTSKFETGVAGTRGNAETFDLRSGFTSTYKTDELRLKLEAYYFYGSVEDAATRNEYYVYALDDFYLPGSSWYLFTEGRYDWNAFRDWYSRVSMALGAGYKFVDSQEWKVAARAGAGFTREYGSENDLISPEGLLGFALDWKMAETQDLHLDSTYYPDLQSDGEYRVVSNLTWQAALADSNAVALAIGLIDEYSSEVETDFEHNDLKYYGALVVKL